MVTMSETADDALGRDIVKIVTVWLLATGLAGVLLLTVVRGLFI